MSGGGATDALMVVDKIIRQVYTQNKEKIIAEFREQRDAEMAGKRKIALSEQQYVELVRMRDHAPVP